MMANKTLAACLAEIKANPGKFYVYILSRPDGTPFYVGFGKQRRRCTQRIAVHRNEAKSSAQSRKLAVIRGIWIAGGDVSYRIDSWHQTREAASRREISIIAQLGRADIGTGILANMTDGGDGQGISKANRQASSVSRTKWWSVDGRKEAQSKRSKAMWKIHGANWRTTLLAAAKAPERQRQYAAQMPKLAEKARQRWLDPEYRAWKLEQQRGYTPSAETRLKTSASAKAALADPEVRAKISASSKRQWADPAFREKVMAARKRAAELKKTDEGRI